MSKPEKEPDKGTSPLAVLQTVAWMEKQGLKPVPLHHQSKAAINRDYVSLDYKPPGSDLWRKRLLGVGCVTGPLQNGPIDADLDCEEAVFFAARFLPPTTAIFGRSGKPRSHYLYRVDTTTFEKTAFTDPADKNSTILELRGDGGHQTVFPGSLHQDTGETIEWAKEGVAFPDIGITTSEQLRKAAAKIAIATLIVRYIWSDGYHNEPCKHLSGMFFYLEWPVDDAVEMIEAVMAYTNDSDKSRIPTIRSTYKRGESGKKISGAGVLRKQLGNDVIVDKLLELAGSPNVNLLQEYNERFAVVSVEGKFRIAEADCKPGDSPVFFQKDDWINFVATEYSGLINENTEKPIPKCVIWLADPRRRSYKNVDFMPGVTDHGTVFNIWTGWGVEPAPMPTGKKPNIAHGCEAWLELLREVICGGDEELYWWMLNWFANIVREPMQKSLTAPVIIGVEGAGKSYLCSYFGKILASGYVPVTQADHITGKFSSHLATCLLLHSEEALYAGDPRHASIIRSLITDSTQMLEKKGIDAKKVRNFIRLILTSNKVHAAAVAAGDRRFTVIDMKDRKLSDDLLLRLRAEFDTGTLEGPGPAALFRYLMHFDYDPKIARVNVKNDSLLSLKMINGTPMDQWWYSTLCSGQLLPDYLAWAALPYKEQPWPELVASPALYVSMVLFLKDRNARNIPNDTLLSFQLDKYTGVKLKRSQRSFKNDFRGDNDVPKQVSLLGDRMNSITNMPTLEDCRLSFERYMGQRIEWPVDDQPEPRPGSKKSVKKPQTHERY